MTYYHLAVLVHERAKKYGDSPALHYRNYETGRWMPISWNEFSKTSNLVANALVELGVSVQENIGLFSQNKPEGIFLDFGAFANRAVTVPLYATSSPSQTDYIVTDASIRLLFVGEQYQYDTAYSIITDSSTLQQIIVFDRTVQLNPADKSSIYFEDFLKLGAKKQHQTIVDQRTADASLDDLANILYTSGTTGEPKGVTLTHEAYYQAFINHDERLENFTDKDISISFLPMTHIFERAWVYLCIHVGVQIYINLRPTDIQKTIREVRPTVMCSVPRFWEKVYDGVQDKIESSSPLLKWLMTTAISTGKAYNVDHLRVGKKPSLWLRLKYAFFDRTAIQLLKKTLGVDRGNLFPTAGAAVPDKVCEFVHAVGIDMLVGYGLTESTATVSCTSRRGYTIGSVGQVMPNVEIKIGENDEILLRGKTMTRGYYKRPEENAKSIDKEGWFHTGDAGYLKGDEIYLRERIKDLYKTSNGKYIAPQALETQLITERMIDQILVVADQRKFVSALIVPDYKAVKAYAEKLNIAYSSMEELLKAPAIYQYFEQKINAQQANLANYEKIKRFRLLPEPFSLEKGELTNTMKIKRSVVFANYEQLIDEMYKG